MLLGVTTLRPMKLLALMALCLLLTLEDQSSAAPPAGMECAAEIVPVLKSAAEDKDNCAALHAHCVHSDNKAKLKMQDIRCGKSVHAEHNDQSDTNLLDTMLNNCKSHLTTKATETSKALIALLETKQPNAVKVLNTICNAYEPNPAFDMGKPQGPSNMPFILDTKTPTKTAPSQAPWTLLADLSRHLDHSVPRLDPNIDDLAQSIGKEALNDVFNGYCPSTDPADKLTYASNVMVADCPDQNKPEEVRLMCNNEPQKKPKILLTDLLAHFHEGNPLANMIKAKEKMTAMLCTCQAVKKPTSWKKEEVMTKFVKALKSC